MHVAEWRWRGEAQHSGECNSPSSIASLVRITAAFSAAHTRHVKHLLLLLDPATRRPDRSQGASAYSRVPGSFNARSSGPPRAILGNVLWRPKILSHHRASRCSSHPQRAEEPKRWRRRDRVKEGRAAP